MASGYKIYRSIDGKNYHNIATIKNRYTSSYIDSNLKKNIYYRYKVVPFYIKNNVKYSGTFSEVKAGFIYKKRKVQNINILQTNYDTNIISWKSIKGITGYKVYASPSKNGSYKKIGITKKNYFYHSNLKLGKVYYYKVVSYRNINGINYYGIYSNKIRKKMKLEKPKLKIIALKGSKLKIKYSKVHYVDYYMIYRADGSNNYRCIKKIKQSSFVDNNLKKYGTYYYKIIAVSKVINGKRYKRASNIDYETVCGKNAKYKLNLKSVYGDIEAYHPDILYFKKKWHGYKYWISFTPYPNATGSDINGDYRKENPHIKVSNDMKNWKSPAFDINPIDVPSFSKEKQVYNSDSEIVYNNLLDRIECYWRTYDEKNGIDLYMKYTIDGKIWSKKELIYHTDIKGKNLLSPSFVYEDGTYKMWYVFDYVIYQKTFNSSFEDNYKNKKINIKFNNLTIYPWHLDVIKVKNKYRMIFVATPKKEYIRHMSLYYSESSDGINWSTAIKILSPSKDKNSWDNRGIYRSSFFYDSGRWYVFYSASNKKNIKGTGIISGKKITDLYSSPN